MISIERILAPQISLIYVPVVTTHCRHWSQLWTNAPFSSRHAIIFMTENPSLSERERPAWVGPGARNSRRSMANSICWYISSCSGDQLGELSRLSCFHGTDISETSYSAHHFNVAPLLFILKGQSNEIFDPQYFSSFEPAWATDQWVKTVWFLVSFSPRYSYFSWVLRSIILRWVKFRAVWYCAESSSAQYHTAPSHVTFPYPF